MGLIPEEQAGFCHGYSTIDNMNIFIDFSKAFDSIDRKKNPRFHCLINKGVHGISVDLPLCVKLC